LALINVSACSATCPPHACTLLISLPSPQAELLAELLGDEEEAAQQQKERAGKKGKKKKGKQQGKVKPAAAATVPKAAGVPAQELEPEASAAGASAGVAGEAGEGEAEEEPELQQAQRGGSGSPTAGQHTAAMDSLGELSGQEKRPGSPEWQVVGRRKREEGGMLQTLSRRHLEGGIGGGRIRRCPSASSLGSSCRWVGSRWWVVGTCGVLWWGGASQLVRQFVCVVTHRFCPSLHHGSHCFPVILCACSATVNTLLPACLQRREP